MKKSLLALALGTFGLGMAEFVMMGILPDVAKTMMISIPTAGHFISAYALGVAFGALLIAFCVRTKPLKSILIGLVLLHLTGNLLTSISPNYHVMLLMRFISGLPHGVFFGVGSIVAKKIAETGKHSMAVATMVSGMTIANLAGIPFGTFISHVLSWRLTFLFIGLFGILILMAVIKWIPYFEPLPDNGFKGQFKFLKSLAPWLIILAIMFGNGGIFCWFSYVNPVLTKVSGFAPQLVSLLMIVAGLGMCVGNFVGGKLSDKFSPPRVAAGVQLMAACILICIFLYSSNQAAAILMTFLCSFCLFAISAPQQVLIIEYSKGGELLGAALAQIAFNIGNAIGAYLGGLPVESGYAFQYCAIPGVVIASLGAIALLYFSYRYAPSKKAVVVPAKNNF